MPRKAIQEKLLCCACLSQVSGQVPLTHKDSIDQKDYLTKLLACVPEVKWEPSFHICLLCKDFLDNIEIFRQTCLKAEETRQKQLLKQARNNKKKCRKENKDITNKNNVKEDLDEKLKNIIFGENKNFLKVEEIIKNVEFFSENNYADDDEIEETVEENQDNNSDISKETDNKTSGLSIVTKKRQRKRVTYQFSCDQCSFTSTSSVTYVEHCDTEHGMIDIKPFKCNRCPSRFLNSSNLTQHQKYHDQVRSNMCTYCGKGFITKTDLVTHEKHHLNKREYDCDECGKSFNTHKDLRSHKLVVHTDSSQWKHECEVCHKRFPIKSNYDSHIKRHTGEKNFECNLCQRKFTDKCVLQRHMKTHSNFREFRCKECNREYKDHRVMRIHMAKIHNIGLGEIKLPTKERKYQCHICPKAYYAKNKLTRHLLVHSGEKPYACIICNKRFNDKSYVKQHLRKTHSMDSDMVNSIKFEVE